MEADDTERLHVEMGGELSVTLDLSGSDESAGPVLEACGY